PPIAADHRTDPVNSLGYLRAMFAVSDIDETLERLQGRGATLVGDVVQYESAYRLCYVRGPEGILVGLAEELPAGSGAAGRCQPARVRPGRAWSPRRRP